MGVRVARSVRQLSIRQHHDKQELETRKQVEESLAVGEPTAIPNHLTKTQKVIYGYIYDLLKETGYTSALDVDTIAQGAIIIDRLREIDKHINSVGAETWLYDKELRLTRSEYFKQYTTICTALCLSPQSRAKMGILACKAEVDPLAEILGGGKQ